MSVFNVMWEDCGNNIGDSTRFAACLCHWRCVSILSCLIVLHYFTGHLYRLFFFFTFCLIKLLSLNPNMGRQKPENSLITRLLLNVTVPSLSSFLLNDSLHSLFLFSCVEYMQNIVIISHISIRH